MHVSMIAIASFNCQNKQIIQLAGNEGRGVTVCELTWMIWGELQLALLASSQGDPFGNKLNLRMVGEGCTNTVHILNHDHTGM